MRSPTPGFNRRLREADADYNARLAAREERKREIETQAGYDASQGQQFPKRNGRQRMSKARKARRRH